MQVGSSYLPALPVATDYRRGAYGRAPQVPPTAARAEQPESTETTRLRMRPSAATQGAEQRIALAENVAERNRPALQAYQSNGPTIAERFGVELAGIDVFA